MTNLESVKKAAEEVFTRLGPGYKENAYESALAHELRLRDVAYDRQRNFEILYKGYNAGEGRVDFIINPRRAGRGGSELVIELKTTKAVKKEHTRQAQVYMSSLGIDEGAVFNFSTQFEVHPADKPERDPAPGVAKPKRASRQAVPALLKAGAEEAYRYLGQEFVYCDNAQKVFTAAIGIELRLRGCAFTGLNHQVLYKGQVVDEHAFDFHFADGSVADTTFYDGEKKLKELSTALARYKKAAGIKTVRLIAIPKSAKDNLQIVTV